MAAEEDEKWLDIFPNVLDLLLKEPDKIIDDTSIEKLLAWISEVCSTSSGREKILHHLSSFLSNEDVSNSCTTASFALRICGTIWSNDAAIFKEQPRLIELFAKAKRNFVFWEEAVVRDAYFSGLTCLTVFVDGLQWLQDNKGMRGRECKFTCSFGFV